MKPKLSDYGTATQGQELCAHSRQASMPACEACGAFYHLGKTTAPHESAPSPCPCVG